MEFQKLLTLGATSLVAFTSVVNADYDDSQLRNIENRVSCLEQKRCNGMINPSARPVIDDGLNLYVTADLIYWKTHENGLGYVIRNAGTATGGATGTITNAKVKNVSHDYDPGFRVGVGYNLPHDGWDVYLNWTRYTSHENDQTNAPLGSGTLIPTFNDPAIYPPGGVLTQANANWKMRLNVLDLELGREFFISKYLTLRPFGGLRSAWVRQSMDINYNYVTAPSTLTVVSPSMQNKFWGMGLHTGLNVQWGLGDGWSLFGESAFSLLYGYHNITQTEKSTTGAAVTTNLDVKDHPRIGRAITDLAGGVRWEQSFSCDSYRVRLQGGWEQHMYFGQNQYDKFVDSLEPGVFVTNQGDVSFEGWVLRAQLDF